MSIAGSLAKKIGLTLAVLHALAAVAMGWSVVHSPDGFSAAPWLGAFYLLDMPVSLIYMLPGIDVYHEFVGQLEERHLVLAWVLYLPHPLHGVLGTAWWYFLPKLVLPKRLGGIWGKQL